MRKLIISILTFISINTNATQYYISASGNDANNGTSTSTPFKTISKVNSVAKVAGDIFSFHGGDTFVGEIINNGTGTSGNPIIYNSYGTGQAIITSFVSVTSWNNLGSNIWESSSAVSSAATLYMVLINGNNEHQGRTPNTGWYTYQSHSGSTSITSTDLNSATTNWTGATVVMRSIKFTLERNPITSQSASTIFYSGGLNPGTNGYGFFIQNDPRTLDVQNEWYYNTTTKKIRIYSTTQPTGVQVPSLDELVFNSSHNYITFDNLTFDGANTNIYEQRNSQHITIQNCNLLHAGKNAVLIDRSTSSGDIMAVKNNTIRVCNDHALNYNLYSSQDSITGNTIDSSGMILGGFENGQDAGSAIQLHCNTGQWGVASYNVITNSGHMAIYMTQTDKLKASYNYISNYGMTVYDGGGIYSFNADTNTVTTRIIDHNIILNSNQVSSGIAGDTRLSLWAVYLDGNSNNTTVTNNSLSNGSTGGIHLYRATSNINLSSNTIYNNGNAIDIVNDANVSYISSLTQKNNILFAKTASQLCFSFRNDMNVWTQFGTSDSNYFCRPISEGLTINTQVVFTQTLRNLAMWQTLSGQDAHSHISPATISNTNQLFFAYNPNNYDSTVTIPSGTWKDATGASYATSTVLHAYSSIVLISTGSLITPNIVWANPAAITYPTALSGTQLNATTSPVIAGTYAYTPASGTILNSGTQLLKVVFTPTDGTTYSTATKIDTLVVNAGTATLSASNTTQTYTGSPLQPTITTSPTGLTTINTTYNGVGTIPTNAGSYSCVSGLTNANYTATPISYTFTISKATATITVSNTTQTYTGTNLPVTTSVSPSVSGLTVTYNGSSTVPTNAGSYTVVATLTNANYTATPVTTTLVINKTTPTVTWATPAAITYGTALSGTQLNATASVAGVFTYSPASGTILNAGTNILSVNFIPTDATNYNSVNNTTVSLVVNKATATISLSNLNQTYDGSPKPVTVTTSPVGLTVITTTYNGSTTVPSAVGSYPVSSTLNNSNYTATPATGTLIISSSVATIFITNYANLVYNGSPQTPTVTCAYSYAITYNGSSTAPTNVGSYTTIATINDGIHTGADTVTMTIIKATPVITWANPTAITYGTALSGTQLNASTPVAGTFTYTPISGTVLNAGTYVLSTSFAPTDASNYNTATQTVNLTVNKASATLSLSNLNQVYDGTPKPVTVTSTPSNLSGIAITYNGSSTIPTNAGSYPVIVTLTNDNYTASNVTGTLVIAKASSILSWATPAAVQQGTALSSAQLNATSTGAGTFAYSPTFGYVVQNNITLNATFTPTDTTNYNIQTISVLLSVYGNPIHNHYIKSGKTVPLNLQ